MKQIHVEIKGAFAGRVNPEKIKAAARATLEHQGVAENAEMSVIITDNSEIRELNAKYRGVDYPTDVLSFSDGSADPETGAVYLGDVVVSYPKAEEQALGKHPVEWELCLLVVHGTLHLLGHDHVQPQDKQRMWAAQSEVLESLGCPLSPP